MRCVRDVARKVRGKRRGLTEEKRTLEIAHAVLDAPREGLRARHEGDADLDGDGQGVGGLEHGAADARAARHGRVVLQALRDAHGVAGLEEGAGAEVAVQADVGEAQHGGGVEGDGSVGAGGVEAALRGALPAGLPGLEGVADVVDVGGAQAVGCEAGDGDGGGLAQDEDLLRDGGDEDVVA